ncbi:HU family DNA-binding protein [Gracilimonas sp. Q87]|uniref:HU family DNA-binding protein n=1 Tax=Gracilimonas sp. Q87 TaxID=3384766 RepID=UPI00398450EC
MMNKKVTYSDIVNALSKKTGFSKHKSEEFVKALLNEVKDELKGSGKASITNFGSFKVKEVAERQGKNPQTGDPITIPAHKRVSFSPFKSLREDVNAEYGHLESELIEEEESSADNVATDPGESPESGEVESEEKIDEDNEDDISSAEAETDEQGSDAEPEVKSTLEEEVVNESEEPDISEIGEASDSEEKISEPPIRKEKNYTNLLASLAVLLLTIIAITSVWFLMDNGKKEGQQNNAVTRNNVQSGNAADGREVAQSQNVRNFESIKNEADELEKRLNKMIEEEERLKAQEKERAERSVAARESTSNNDSSEGNGSNYSVSEDQPSVQNYEVEEGEWYWVISDKLYGKPRFWPLLFKENHSVNEDPDKLFEQVSIKVPDMEGTAANPTKQDYKELAAASKMVAQAYKNAGKTEKANEYAKFARMWEQLGA